MEEKIISQTNEQLETIFIEIIKIKELQKFILSGMGVDPKFLKEF